MYFIFLGGEADGVGGKAERDMTPCCLVKNNSSPSNIPRERERERIVILLRLAVETSSPNLILELDLVLEMRSCEHS